MTERNLAQIFGLTNTTMKNTVAFIMLLAGMNQVSWSPIRSRSSDIYSVFDASSGLLIQEDFGGASLRYDDYKEVDGVKVPFAIRQEGSPNSTIKFKEIKHNLPIEDAKFDRPKRP